MKVRSDDPPLGEHGGNDEPAGRRRKSAKQEHARQARILRAVAGSSTGIWEIDFIAGTMYLSAAVKRIFGLPPGARLTLEDRYRLLHPEDRERVAALMQRAVATGSEYVAQYRIVRPDGGERWIESRGRGEADTQGRVLRMEGLLRDITEAKHAELAREISELRFRTLIESISQMIWIGDEQGQITELSPSVARMLGIPPEQTVGDGWLDAVHPEDRERVVAAWMGAVANRQAYSNEFRLRMHDGQYRYFRVQGVLLEKGQGQGREWIGIGTDVDDQRRAEQARLASERRFEAMVRSISHYVWFADEQGNLTHISGTLQRMLGPAAAATLGSGWQNLLHPDDVAGAKEAWAQAVARGGTYNNEYRVRMRDGRYRYYQVQAAQVERADGQGREWIGVGVDVDERRRTQQELAESRQRLSNILDCLTDVVWSMCGRTGRMLYLGPAIEELSGWPHKSFLDSEKFWFSLVHPEDRERVKNAFDGALGQPPFDIEFRIHHADGGIRWVRARGKAIVEDDGFRIDGVASDVTDRRQQQDRIIRLSRLQAVHAGIDALIVRARSRRELFEGACRIAVEQGQFKVAWCGLRNGERIEPSAWGGARSPCLEQHARISFVTCQSQGAAQVAAILAERLPCISNDATADPSAGGWALAAAEAGVRSRGLFPLVVRGELAGVLALYAGESGFFDAEETKLCNMLTADIAYAMEFIHHTEELEYLAYYDALTGLANRRRFTDQLDVQLTAARDSGEGLAVLVIDLASFKSVNDALGMKAGDRLLRRAARRLRRVMGGSGLIGRLGGDRFAVVVPAIRHASDLDAVLDETRWKRWNRAYRLQGQELRIIARAGIALYEGDETSAETLIQNAEAALKNAKIQGETHLFYTGQMGAKLKTRLRLETELRAALERSEFVLHYQPQVDLRAGTICGAEALLRWNRPGAGLVLPGHFIQALEETGLIQDVGRWALRQAAADLRRWHEQGLRALRISVNVSSTQLRRPDFVAEYAAATGSASGVAAAIDLEVTESVLMADATGTIEKLRKLQAMGVGVAIDDFGTGYSSLAYLSKLPVSALKIDRSFVVAMAENAANMGIVSTIIALAQSMNLRVVAEGVESDEQLKFLRLLRCHEFQGFVFSPALPAEQLAEMVREGRGL